MRSNIRQVAERAGVSRTTVSNVLLGRHDIVAPDKCRLVMEAVRELDYVPVRPTLQNRHTETRVVALPVDEPRKIGWGINSGTYMGMCESAMSHGYDVLMLLRPDPDWATESSQVQFLDRRSDGIVFASPIIGESQATFKTLVKHEIPTVVCYRRDLPNGIAWVDPDNKGIMFQAVEHLVQMGHTKIAHLSEDQQRLFDNLERRRYFQEAMCHYGLSEWANTIVAAPTYSVTPDVVEQIMSLGVTAVTCHNDLLALNLWTTMESMGLSVPDDLSIVGVDGLEAEERGLTSVEFSFSDVGRKAVDGLVARIQGAPVNQCCHIIPGQLRARRSVKNLAASRNDSQ